jgi:hypothetical protein
MSFDRDDEALRRDAEFEGNPSFSMSLGELDQRIERRLLNYHSTNRIQGFHNRDGLLQGFRFQEAGS